MELKVRVRYAREASDPGVPGREENLTHGEREWAIPAEQAALVLVDCWSDYDVLESVSERTREVAFERILPAVESCRSVGATIVHAPSPEWAHNYPQWLRYAGDDEFLAQPAADPGWPPVAFRRREGEYGAFRAPALWEEPTYRKWLEGCPPQERKVFDFLGPAPEDFVVATGGQLHRLCRDRRILHLFYAGFAANICLQHRDYGVRLMRARGYNIILLRDCTSAIEQPETLGGLWLTRAAILDIELKVGASTTSEELQRACRQALAAGA